MTVQTSCCSPQSSLSAQYPIWRRKLHAAHLSLVYLHNLYIKISTNWMVSRSDFLPIIIWWYIACLLLEKRCFHLKCLHVLYCLIRINFLFDPLHFSILLEDLFVLAEQATIPSLLNTRPFQLWITCSSFLNGWPFHCSSLHVSDIRLTLQLSRKQRILASYTENNNRPRRWPFHQLSQKRPWPPAPERLEMLHTLHMNTRPLALFSGPVLRGAVE